MVDGSPAAMREDLKIMSLLAQYPSNATVAAAAEIVAAVGSLPPGGTRSNLQKFLAYWCSADPDEVRGLYIRSFELAAGTTLNLTYHRYGDGRERGAAISRLKQRLREAGYDLATGELPDYLPLLLEFAAVSPAGLDLIGEYRAPVEAIRLRLEGEGHPYAPLLNAMAEALPPLSDEQKQEAAAILQKKGLGDGKGSGGRVVAGRQGK